MKKPAPPPAGPRATPVRADKIPTAPAATKAKGKPAQSVQARPAAAPDTTAPQDAAGVIQSAATESAKPPAQLPPPVKLTFAAAQKIVDHLYWELLGRAAEPTNREGVAGSLLAGQVSIRGQIMSMMKSEEFQFRAVAEKSPDEISDLLFQVLLSRQPNAAERAAAAQCVAEQGYRAQVDALANSAEYMDRFGDDRLPLF
jgi:hypothetical protein